MLILASGAMLAQLLGLDPNDKRVEGLFRSVPVRFFRRQRQQPIRAKTAIATRPMTTPMMMATLLSLRSGWSLEELVDEGDCVEVASGFAVFVCVGATVLDDAGDVAFGL
jgi:hypothetical protein